MRDFVRRFGLRGGGQAPVSFPASFKPSFGATKSVFGGAAQARASFLSFDGTSTFVEWSTGPSTVSNGRRGTFVVPFNRKGGSGAECILYVGTTTGESVFIGFDSSNHLVARISDGAVGPTTILEIVSTTTYADSVNRVAIFSFDLDTIGGDAFYWLYVNDTDVGDTPTTGTPADIDCTNTWRIGSTDDSGDRQWYSGATGHILFYPEVFPLPDANTRKYFYDATADGPVDQGSDGSDALGDQPPLYWATTASAATTNAGDGGDADSASSFSDAADPPNLASLPAFVANALDITDNDVSGDFMDISTGLPAAASVFLFHIAFKRDRLGGGTINEIFLNINNLIRTRLFFFNDDTLELRVYDGGTEKWRGLVDGAVFDSTATWYTLTICGDVSTFGITDDLTAQVNGTSYGFTSIGSKATGNIGFADSPWRLFEGVADTTRNFDGGAAEFMVAAPSSYIDLSVAANIAKFYSGGKPVFQGLTGMKYTGVRPHLWLRAPAAQANLNSGTMPHPTVTGTITDFSSSPTD